MKPRESLIRTKQFKVEELRRRLAQCERMIEDLRAIRTELGRQIEAEERRTGVADPTHFAYSTVARAARERRDKLDASIRELAHQRAATEDELTDMLDFFASLPGAGEDGGRAVAAQRAGGEHCQAA